MTDTWVISSLPRCKQYCHDMPRLSFCTCAGGSVDEFPEIDLLGVRRSVHLCFSRYFVILPSTRLVLCTSSPKVYRGKRLFSQITLPTECMLSNVWIFADQIRGKWYSTSFQMVSHCISLVICQDENLFHMFLKNPLSFFFFFFLSTVHILYLIFY